MRTRACPCTSRTAKNSWSSSGYSNRRDRGHPDQAETKLNCPPIPLHHHPPTVLLRHTNTTLSPSSAHTQPHTHCSCILLSCMSPHPPLACPPGPRGPNRPWLCSPGVLWWYVSLSVRRKLSGLLGCPVPSCACGCVCPCPCVPLQIFGFMCRPQHEPPPPTTAA